MHKFSIEISLLINTQADKNETYVRTAGLDLEMRRKFDAKNQVKVDQPRAQLGNNAPFLDLILLRVQGCQSGRHMYIAHRPHQTSLATLADPHV